MTGCGRLPPNLWQFHSAENDPERSSPLSKADVTVRPEGRFARSFRLSGGATYFPSNASGLGKKRRKITARRATFCGR